jgi:hypothetical protein
MVLHEVPTANDGWVSNFDQFFVGLPIKLIEAATSNVGSTPRLAEDVVCSRRCFPSRRARNALRRELRVAVGRLAPRRG